VEFASFGNSFLASMGKKKRFNGEKNFCPPADFAAVEFRILLCEMRRQKFLFDCFLDICFHYIESIIYHYYTIK